MRGFPTMLFAAIGFLMGLAMQSPLHGITFYDWRGPLASLAMAGFGAGTGSGMGQGDDQPFRRGIRGSVMGAATGAVLGMVGAGFVVTAIAAVILALSMSVKMGDDI